jgi:hypothetical protein
MFRLEYLPDAKLGEVLNGERRISGQSIHSQIDRCERRPSQFLLSSFILKTAVKSVGERKGAVSMAL